MITWLQNIFFKHNKWLFSALLVVIIVTFVLTIGNQSFFGSGQTYDVERREYYGYDLNNREDGEKLMLHADLSLGLDPYLRFSPGFNRSVGSREDFALLRVAALGLANQIGIPDPTSDQLSEYIRTLSGFIDPATGDFDQSRFAQFRDSLATNPRIAPGTLTAVLKEDYRIARLRDALGGPGYLLPFEGAQGYRMSETEWTLRIATADFADFDPEIEVSTESLQQYYEENPGRYTLPERLRVSAIFFRAPRFVDETEMPTEAALTAYFNRNRTRYQPPANAVQTEAPEPITLDDVRAQVVSDLREENARVIAQRYADDFVATLYEAQIPQGSEAFDAAMAEHRGVRVALAPYGREATTTASAPGIAPNLLRSMWIHTTGERYYSDLGETPDGAVVLVFEERLPENLQAFETVAAEVEADWKAEEARRLFGQQMRAREATLRESVAEGAPFSVAAESLEFAVEMPATFKGNAKPSQLGAQIWQETQLLDTGEISPLVIDDSGATLTYVEAKSPPAAEVAGMGENQYARNLASQRQALDGWLALREWYSETLRVALPEEENLDL